MFAEGKLPKSAELVTDVAVLGMFYDNSYPGKSERSTVTYSIIEETFLLTQASFSRKKQLAGHIPDGHNTHI